MNGKNMSNSQGKCACVYAKLINVIHQFSGRDIVKRWLAICIIVFSTHGVAGDIGNQFVVAKLAYGAKVSVPRSWQILRGKEMLYIDTAVGALMDLTGNATAGDGLATLLVANFPDPRLYASVVITAVTVSGIRPSDIVAISESQLKSGASVIRTGTEAMQVRLGNEVYGWTELQRVSIQDRPALHISYRRSSEAGERKVDIYKFFGDGRSYDLALTTSAANESINGLILEKIARSFSAP